MKMQKGKIIKDVEPAIVPDMVVAGWEVVKEDKKKEQKFTSEE